MTARSRRPPAVVRRYEAEIIPGLEAIAAAELREQLGARVVIEPQWREGLLTFQDAGDPARLLGLSTVLAVATQQQLAIPRPKALLGQAVFDALLATIADVRALHPPHAFRTLRISAAGQESSVLARLRDELAARTGLAPVSDEGDLLLRLRRPLDRSDGWEVLVRLSPRPLSARAWRVCNLPGALNASVAHAMARLTLPHPDDAVLNLACGSATLLIERLRAAPARIALGCDTDEGTLACARDNLAASGNAAIRLENWDAGALPTPDAWVDALLADLPFGQLVGSHAANTVLYPRLLREAARVIVPGGLFVSITQDMRLWEHVIADDRAWLLDRVLPIKIPFSGGYLHPRIYVLRRDGA